MTSKMVAVLRVGDFILVNNNNRAYADTVDSSHVKVRYMVSSTAELLEATQCLEVPRHADDVATRRHNRKARKTE